jgi:hypothetical protein
LSDLQNRFRAAGEVVRSRSLSGWSLIPGYGSFRALRDSSFRAYKAVHSAVRGGASESDGDERQDGLREQVGAAKDPKLRFEIAIQGAQQSLKEIERAMVFGKRAAALSAWAMSGFLVAGLAGGSNMMTMAAALGILLAQGKMFQLTIRLLSLRHRELRSMSSWLGRLGFRGLVGAWQSPEF